MGLDKPAKMPAEMPGVCSEGPVGRGNISEGRVVRVIHYHSKNKNLPEKLLEKFDEAAT